jgi:hypothetical protein
MIQRERNRLITEQLKKWTEEMTREPGAKERCQAYLKELGKKCSYWYDEEGNIHYEQPV